MRSPPGLAAALQQTFTAAPVPSAFNLAALAASMQPIHAEPVALGATMHINRAQRHRETDMEMERYKHLEKKRKIYVGVTNVDNGVNIYTRWDSIS